MHTERPNDWTGWFSYPAEIYGPKLAAQPIAFRLAIRHGWFGRFSGFLFDNVTQAESDEPGKVRGYIRGQKIFFSKKYRSFVVISPEGQVISGREYLERKYQVQLTMDVNPPIHYLGHFNDTFYEAAGEWILEEFVIPIRTGGLFKFPRISGSWAMRPAEIQQPAASTTA